MQSAIFFQTCVAGENSSVKKQDEKNAYRLSTLKNPLFSGADPDVLFAQGKYWLYPTAENDARKGHVYSSKDLKVWVKQGPIFDFKNVKWIDADGSKVHYLWAPGIFQRDGKYYYYYSVGPQNPTPSRIGVAVSTKPEGPFVDSGAALITGDAKFEAIDAMVFTDPKTKNIYLYCGGSAGAKLKIFELNPDLISVKREIKTTTPKDFTEGAFMHFRNGTYYLSYSSGRWSDDSYHVSYCTAPSPVGPWKFEGVILATDLRHAGPGHHCIINSSAGDTENLHIFYHRWNAAKADGKMPPSRSIAVEKLQYRSNGKIRPVIMTD